MISVKAIIALIAAIASGVAAIAHRLWGPQARARERLRTGTAVLADQAIVTLTGTVRVPAEPLVAPLSGRPCVIYTTVMRLYEPAGRKGRVEIANVTEHEMIEFDLEVDEHVIRVAGNTAELGIEPRAIIPRRIERERALLDKHERDRAHLRLGVFQEASIGVGDRVVVQGLAVLDHSPAHAGSYRDDRPRYRMVAHADHPLTIGEAR